MFKEVYWKKARLHLALFFRLTTKQLSERTANLCLFGPVTDIKNSFLHPTFMSFFFYFLLANQRCM